MRALLLIPSFVKRETVQEVANDRHPRMDYDALANGLRTAGIEIRLLDYGAVERERALLIRLTCRLAGRDAALALLGFQQRRWCQVFFTNGENVAIPLALLLKLVLQRPGHVTIGHRLSTGKKRLFFTLLRVQGQIDTLFVYARTQWEHAVHRLEISPEKLSHIHFHADDRFYRPLPERPVSPRRICSAGLEWRDYPTLIDAVRDAPDLDVQLAAASPWSKHRDETAGSSLPAHVAVRCYSYSELRELYATSSVVAVPLYENDFQAGVTTLLEAMAMGKAVVVTRTTGQTDVLVDGENGLLVAPGDVEGWQQAISGLLSNDAHRERLGRNARAWVEEHATLDRWVGHLVAALQSAATAVPRNRENVAPAVKPNG